MEYLIELEISTLIETENLALIAINEDKFSFGNFYFNELDENRKLTISDLMLINYYCSVKIMQNWEKDSAEFRGIVDTTFHVSCPKKDYSITFTKNQLMIDYKALGNDLLSKNVDDFRSRYFNNNYDFETEASRIESFNKAYKNKEKLLQKFRGKVKKIGEKSIKVKDIMELLEVGIDEEVIAKELNLTVEEFVQALEKMGFVKVKKENKNDFTTSKDGQVEWLPNNVEEVENNGQ